MRKERIQEVARTAKDTISIEVNENLTVEVMPIREFSLSELTDAQKDYLIGLGLKQRDGALTRARIKKILPKIQENIKRKADMLEVIGDEAAVNLLFNKPGWETEVPSQVSLSLEEYFKVEETPAADEKTEEKKADTPNNGKGKKGKEKK